MNIKTPAFVFDIDAVKERVKFIKKQLGNAFKICYAVKANPFFIEDMVDVVDALEVCSPGEFRICERLGVAGEKIVLSGVYKENSDIDRIVSLMKDKPLYTVESPAQFDLLCEMAKKHNLILRVCLRLSSGNQFGVDKQDLEKIVVAKNESIKIVGIQLYSGTQKKQEKIDTEVEQLKSYLQEIEQKYKFKFERIEYGPGLGVSYFQSDAQKDDEASLKQLKNLFGFAKDREVVFEFGRFLVAYAGSYYTRVVDMKTNYEVNYLIVDGGINHLNYYGQMMAMKLPFINHDRKSNKKVDKKAYTVCGSLCTTADVLVKNCPLEEVSLGDVLEFERVGAYSVTEGIYLFLSRDMPCIYKKSKKEIKLVRDTLRTDEINSKQ